jgi:hypothetical protein
MLRWCGDDWHFQRRQCVWLRIPRLGICWKARCCITN